MKSLFRTLWFALALAATSEMCGQQIDSTAAYLDLRPPEPIAWGAPVNGLSVGIGAIRAFHGAKPDLIITAYLANRGSIGLRYVIRSEAQFMIELDGKTFNRGSRGGMSGELSPGEVFPPILLVSDKFRGTAPSNANVVPADSMPLQIAPGRHSIRIFYPLRGQTNPGTVQAVPSATLTVDVPNDNVDPAAAVAALAVLAARPVPQFEERLVAIDGLRRLPGDAAVAAIAVALKDPGDSAIRSTAARTLGETKSKSAVAPLAAALSDLDQSVRVAAVQSLAALDDRDVIAILKSRQDDPDVKLRYEVLAALVRLGEPVDVPRVTEVIRTKAMNEFQGGISLIRRYAADQAVQTLIGCLDFNDPSVSSYYNYTLVGQIGASGGPTFRYRSDLDGLGSQADVAENRRILDALRAASLKPE